MPEEEELPNNPSFVFLQLYHSAALSLPPFPGHTPLLLPADEVREYSCRCLYMCVPSSLLLRPWCEQ